MGLIIPGKNVVCVQAVECQFCGAGKASKDAIYMCEGIADGGPHRLWCQTEGCDGFVVLLAGKTCCYCACCFKPLDDGDTSLVKDEEEDRGLPAGERIEAGQAVFVRDGKVFAA